MGEGSGQGSGTTLQVYRQIFDAGFKCSNTICPNHTAPVTCLIDSPEHFITIFGERNIKICTFLSFSAFLEF